LQRSENRELFGRGMTNVDGVSNTRRQSCACVTLFTSDNK